MKTTNLFYTISVAAALIAPAFAQDKPAVIGEYLPVGTLAKGNAVRVQFDEALPTFLKKFDEAVAKLPQDEQMALKKTLKPGYPIPFDARLGCTREEYDQYLACFRKKQVVPAEEVAVGIEATETPKVWKLASTNGQGPLHISALSYNAEKDTWESNNGTLVRKPDLTFEKDYNFGAWKGQEWTLEKKDGLSQFAEQILMGKTEDGKSVYVVYNMLEATTAGKMIANVSYVLMFPAQNQAKTIKKASKQ